MRTKPIILVLLSTVILCFQNCSPLTPTAESRKSSRPPVYNGGQPYDGKTYVLNRKCPDGTLVESRIMYRNGKGILYRENCTTIPPREITPSELALDMSNPDQIIYAARTYAIEEPAIPLPGVISWFLQLTGALQSRPASIYIVDMYGTDADTIAALKTAGHTVICNISAGTVEDWNPDSDQFPAAAIGNRVAGGPGEHWIDIRSTEIRSIMLNRIRLASDKGCHGINLDAAESYSNNTGFPLTDANQLDYNQFLAFGAHDRGLILSLNNAAELAAETSQVFDFVIAEQCFQYHECESYLPFIYKNKPVLVAEYGPVSATQCAEAESLKLSLSYLSSHLDGSRYETCQ